MTPVMNPSLEVQPVPTNTSFKAERAVTVPADPGNDQSVISRCLWDHSSMNMHYIQTPTRCLSHESYVARGLGIQKLKIQFLSSCTRIHGESTETDLKHLHVPKTKIHLEFAISSFYNPCIQDGSFLKSCLKDPQ